MAKKPKPPTEITSTRHKHDTRVNIPTEELRDFVAEDEKAPKAVLYPRDQSLDPQLVWKGKDEQDANPLEVPVVPKSRSLKRVVDEGIPWRRMRLLALVRHEQGSPKVSSTIC